MSRSLLEFVSELHLVKTTLNDWGELEDYVFSPPPCKRKGPLRYSYLPIEIRYSVLEILLGRATVALTEDVVIKQRFRCWDREGPE